MTWSVSSKRDKQFKEFSRFMNYIQNRELHSHIFNGLCMTMETEHMFFMFRTDIH